VSRPSSGRRRSGRIFLHLFGKTLPISALDFKISTHAKTKDRKKPTEVFIFRFCFFFFHHTQSKMGAPLSKSGVAVEGKAAAAADPIAAKANGQVSEVGLTCARTSGEPHGTQRPPRARRAAPAVTRMATERVNTGGVVKKQSRGPPAPWRGRRVATLVPTRPAFC